MGEVYSVGFDLSALEKALKMSLQIKNNLSGLGSAGIDQGPDYKKISDALKVLKDPPAFKKLDKAFKIFNKDLNKGNKQLKEQGKLLSKNLQTMKLMRMVGGGLKMGLGALGIGAGITGIVGALTKPYSGNLSTNLRAKNIGLSVQEHDALGFAGKMTGLGEDTLISAIEGLTTAIEDPQVWTHFASLGLNANDLQKKKPTEAFFDVLKSMKQMKDKGYWNNMIKENIDSIGIPFDSFRFILKDGTNDLERFFNEGKRLNKDNDKYAKGVWELNKATGKWEQVSKGLIDAERETIRFMENFGGTMKHISYDIAPPYIDGLKSITNLLPTLETTLSKSINWGLDFMKGLTETPEEDRAKYFYDQLTKPLMDAIGGAFQKGIDSLMDSFKEQFKPLFDGWEEFKGAFKSPQAFLKYFFTIGKDLSPPLNLNFNDNLSGVNSIDNAFTTLAQGNTESLELLIDAFKDKLLTKEQSQLLYNTYLGKSGAEKYGFTKDDFFDNYNQKQVNDAIITPNNQIIKTNPKDYIFAMKRPQDLASCSAGAGGANHTYTININANVRNDNDIRKLKTELERLIRSFNSKR